MAMGTELVFGALGGIAIACVFFVVYALIRRESAVNEEAPDVLELAHEVAQLKKQVRRAYMSRVREGAPSLQGAEVAEDGPPSMEGPPELKNLPHPPGAVDDLKSRLRAVAYGTKK